MSALTARFSSFVATHPHIVLGTASSSRRAVLDELANKYSFKYDIVKADINEKAIRRDDPEELVLALAHAKADAILQKLAVNNSSQAAESRYLITCDQVVVHEGQLREKPESTDEAHRFIHSYCRSPAQTVGSVVCTNLQTGSQHETVEVCTIHMSDMPDDVIDQLIAEGDIMWCAGGLMIEHPLVAPYITSIEGSQDSVMGLGKEAVMQVLLEAAGL
eukprot:GHRR01004801.1.p1 GENE.GHRR01004801.1~~GHRR01004801.1.p1  ORF type:complete len:218 (+),score=42.73 GHRR01004801.1:429-1082(+)